jgi:hypothetical protein
MKSYFRVKHYLYLLSAFVLYLFANSGYKLSEPETQLLTISIPMMVIGFLGITLKCECCKHGLFDLESDSTLTSLKKLVSIRTYFPPKICPTCGCNRY